jgi:CheY-like chemotaxis protein
VDDDASGRQALAQLISLWGMEVAAVADGSSALEQARARPPDIVLIDLELPDMNGVELARRLGALLGDGVLLYAFSGYGPDQRSAGLFAGHLEKPIDLDALRRLLGAEC